MHLDPTKACHNPLVFQNMIIAHQELKKLENSNPQAFSFNVKKIEEACHNYHTAQNELIHQIFNGYIDSKLVSTRDNYLKDLLLETHARIPKHFPYKSIYFAEQKLLNSIERGLRQLKNQKNFTVLEVDSSNTVDALKKLRRVSRKIQPLISKENLWVTAEEINWHANPFSAMFLLTAKRCVAIKNESNSDANSIQNAALACIQAWDNLREKLDKLVDSKNASFDDIKTDVESFGIAFSKMKKINLSNTKEEALSNVEVLRKIRP